MVDLHQAYKQGFRASVEEYSLKKVEAFYGFERETPLEASGSEAQSYRLVPLPDRSANLIRAALPHPAQLQPVLYITHRHPRSSNGVSSRIHKTLPLFLANTPPRSLERLACKPDAIDH